MYNRKLTNRKGKFIINNPDGAKIGNGVRHVNYRWIPIFLGVAIGLLLPLVLNVIMFNTPFPCKTMEKYNNGNSLQKCEVRR